MHRTAKGETKRDHAEVRLRGSEGKVDLLCSVLLGKTLVDVHCLHFPVKLKNNVTFLQGALTPLSWTEATPPAFDCSESWLTLSLVNHASRESDS